LRLACARPRCSDAEDADRLDNVLERLVADIGNRQVELATGLSSSTIFAKSIRDRVKRSTL
jgi:hypothetical protein